MSRISYARVSCCHFVHLQGSKESVVLRYHWSFPGKRRKYFHHIIVNVEEHQPRLCIELLIDCLK